MAIGARGMWKEQRWVRCLLCFLFFLLFWLLRGPCLAFSFDCISHIKLKQSVTCECCDKWDTWKKAEVSENWEAGERPPWGMCVCVSIFVCKDHACMWRIYSWWDLKSNTAFQGDSTDAFWTWCKFCWINLFFVQQRSAWCVLCCIFVEMSSLNKEQKVASYQQRAELTWPWF